MNKSRRSFLSRTLRSLQRAWKRRRQRREIDRTFLLEPLEPRLALTISSPLPDPAAHIHPVLKIVLEGDQVVIPKDLGLTSTQHFNPHTHDFTGTLHIGEGSPAGLGTTIRNVTLTDFFDVWRTNAGVSGNNANAIFDTDLTDGTASPRIMNKTVDAGHVLRMYVKEAGDSVAELEYDSSSSSNNIARPELYVPRDGDQITISYDAVATVAAGPSFEPIANQTVLVGAPSFLALDGFDPTGGPLTYSVQVANPSLLSATIATGNRNIAIDVADYGVMKFQLFDDLVPDVTNRMGQLITSGFYNKTGTNQITFHRVINNFMIQGGDPTGTGSGGSNLGDFDDEFNLDLQHTTSGLLSMAKSSDDTNDSQFFITDVPTRHLDFNHSIWGRLTEGEAIRDAINSVPTGANDKPTTPVVINSISFINDLENAVLKLKAANGATGSTNVTVTVTDAQNHTFSQTFQVTFGADTSNSAPFLLPIAPVTGVAGQPIQLQLQAVDAENQAFFFDAVKPTGETAGYTVSANNSSGLVTITPPAGFVGTFNVLVGVSGATTTDTADAFDTELVPVTITQGAPTVDLLATSDSGVSNSDNITNAASLQFEISGVTSGATVKLLQGSTILAQGTASGTSITLTTSQIAALGEGTHAVTATQTINGVEGPVSAALNVVYDITPPAAFTSTAPTEADVGVPLQYNAANPDENSAGFHYELVTPPAGVTINATTGQLSWTPVDAQVGTQNFGISAIDAAGNVRTQSLSVAVAQPLPPKVDLVLQLFQADGTTPLTSINSGQNFVLKVFTRDLRTPSRGVFAAYMDILWDSTKATATGPIVYGSEYGTQQSGTSSAGQLDEVGAVAAQTPIGQGLHELFRIPMVASGSGLLTFAADPADILAAHDTLVYDENVAVNDQIRFGTASVTINTSFNAVGDTFNVNEDSTNNSLNPLANDTNIGSNQNTLTISAVGTTDHGGTVTISGDGKTLIYTPAANFSGTETFTYTAKNQNNETNTATVTVQVQPVNDAPTGVNDTFNVPEDSQNFVLDVLANDLTAPDTGETLRVTQVGTGNHGGTLTIGNNGANIRYTPAQNFIGTETFTYTLSDRATGGLTSTATVTLTVAEANDPPVAGNDTATVSEDSGDTTINVLANDNTGPDTGETISVTAVSNASAGGTISVASNGLSVIYKPAANFQGIETFSYTLTDSRGGTTQGVVTVTVTNSNDPPTATNDTLTGFRNTTSSFDVLANDSSSPDPTENLIVDSVTQPQHGTVTITDGGKKVSYTPTTGYTGPDSFTYVVKDPGGLTSTAATANITVQEFAPSTLGGSVYFDVDDDGQRDTSELPLAGVTITLTGTTTTSQSVNLTVKTLQDGSYKFDGLAPGNYTLKQTQPSFTIDGKDTAGSAGGTVTNDQIVIANLAQATTAANYNFGERGRALNTLSIADLFSSNSRNYAIAALDSSGNELWHSMSGEAWNGYSDAAFSLTSATVLRFQANNAASQPVFTTINTASDKLGLLGESGGSKLFRVRNGLTGVNLTPVTVNQAPIAVANSYTTTEDTALTVPVASGVLANDTDADNNQLTAQVATQPAHGTLTLNPNGTFTYTPTTNFTGTDTFTYRASDGNAQSSPATVTITVTAVNDAPVAINNAYTATLNTPLVISAAAGVLANDSDADGTLTAAVLTQPTHGTLSLAANGSFTYTPASGYTGADSFTYRASDGTATADATVTLTVVATNQAPNATANSYTTNEDTTLTVPVATGVIANDNDPEGNPLSATVLTQPTKGTLTFNANGSFTFVPNANANGTDTFTYKVTDGAVESAAATVTITITAVNDAPTVQADNYTTPAGQALTVAAAQGVLANDTDAEGQTLTATILTQPANGSVTLASNGGFTYTPPAGFNGTATFTYRATDGTTTTDGTVTITVGTNAAPVANNDSYTATEDTPFTSTVANGVLANDTDANSNSLTAVVVTQPATGTLTLNNNGTFTYTPVANASGTVTFTYKANDGTADSNVATVTITIVPVNDAPTATGESYTAQQNTLLTIDATAGVLHNDADVDSASLTAVLVANVQHGTLNLAANGSFTYDPADDYHGPDTFTYKVNDGSADSATVTVTLTVNAPPTAAAESYSTSEDTLLTKAVAEGVLHNDSDPDGNNLAAILVDDVQHGTLSLAANGSFTYDPDDDYNGPDNFTYRASDGTSTSSLITVALTVTAVNDAPVALADTYSTPGGTAVLTVAVADGVLDNDTDIDSSTLTAILVTDVQHGALSLAANGSFTYNPADDFHGADTFTYKVNDGTIDGNTVTVTINVNDPPAGVADAYSTGEDALLTIAVGDGVLDNDTDSDQDPLTAAVVDEPLHGTLTLAANGSFTYDPDENYHGPDSFTYRASDGMATSNLVTVTLTVNPVNDAPVANADSYTVGEDQTFVVPLPSGQTTGGVLANDTDVDQQTLSASVVADVQNGELTLNSNGTFSYTPDPDFVGTDTFTYRASDGTAQSAITTVTFTVNASPTATNDAYEVDEDGTLTVAVAEGVLDNDSDPENDVLTAHLDNDVEHGTLTLAPDGSFVYTPDPGFSGADGFSYHLSDGHSISAVSAVTITVTTDNLAPLAADDSYTTTPGTQLVVDAPGVLTGDTDPDGDSLTAAFSTNPAHGDLTLSSNGSFTYTPDSGFHGSDSFTYLATDGSLGDSGTVTIIVNTLPAVQDDNYQTNEDTLLDVNAELGLLNNDSDADSDPLTVSIVAQPAHGTLTLGTGGAFQYDPADDYTGPDSFTYRVNDTFGNSVVASVSIAVTPVNDGPQAEGESYSTPEGQTLNVDAQSGVLANDDDVDGPSLIASVVTTTTHGQLTLEDDGSFSYVPDAAYSGPDSFVYEVSDGTLASQATVNLSVTEAGEGEGPSAADLALWSLLAEGDGDWQAAVDQAFAELG